MEKKTELLCYCFQVSKLDLSRAIAQASEGDIISEIKTKMKDPGCFCEKANPSGKCCLKDIYHFIQLKKEEN